jgi:tetratricopeptide (TPR) repeat protein
MVAFILSRMSDLWRIVACLTLLLLCLAIPLRAEEETYQPFFPSEEEEFQAPPRFSEDDEVPSSPAFNTTVQEEDLDSEELTPGAVGREEPLAPLSAESPFPTEQFPPFPSAQESPSSSSILPPPGPTPPFLSRPSEWEETPPTVIETPPLPAATSFSGRDLVAFQFVEEGKAHFDREEWEVARERFERAISIAPSLPYSYYFLGRIAFAQGDRKRALAYLQKAELLFPRSEKAWLAETMSVKGTVYEDLQDYEEARTAYRRSLRFQPANLKVLSALARLPEEEPLSSDVVSQ